MTSVMSACTISKVILLLGSIFRPFDQILQYFHCIFLMLLINEMLIACYYNNMINASLCLK